MTLPAEPADWIVAVPTRGDAESLARIERNIVARLPGVPVTVLRNGAAGEPGDGWPGSPSCEVRLVEAPGGGVSRARNGALDLPARTVVFVDDDVVVSAKALELLVRGQRANRAAVSTARVTPAASKHPNAVLFHRFLGFDRGATAHTWSLRERSAPRVSPLGVWDFGVGATFAVDLPALAVASPAIRFDERLSNGRLGGGTEDVDFFYQAYLAGLRISYEAAATVEHLFAEDHAAVVGKCRQYALSDGAFYAKWLRRTSPSDWGREITGWAARFAAQAGRMATGHPAVPIHSLAAEPALKLIGGALWFAVLRRSS